jgi:PleD family two-component response regulator
LGGRPLNRRFTNEAGCALADGDVQAVIERADVALYEAKGQGRNAVVRADEPAETVRQSA